jgi:hypothetical protein
MQSGGVCRHVDDLDFVPFSRPAFDPAQSRAISLAVLVARHHESRLRAAVELGTSEPDRLALPERNGARRAHEVLEFHAVLGV